MPRLTVPQRSALADWWDLATDAANNRQGSQDLIYAASLIASNGGRRLSFAESTALTTLYAYASRIRNAGEEARAADDAAYITDKHVAVPPWAREEREQNANPTWHVTYHFTFEQNGVTSTVFKTSVFEHGQFPDTIGELKAKVAEDADVLANKYRVNLLNTDLHQILAV